MNRPIQASLLPVLGLAMLISLALLTVAVFFRDAPNQSISFEIAKALLQVGVVAVAGGIVTLLVFEYQRRRHLDDRANDLARAAWDYRETLLTSVLSRAMAAYSRTKKARRLLRAYAITSSGDHDVVLATYYDDCLAIINDAQLDFESLVRDVETSAAAFSDPSGVANALRTVERFLGKVIGEFERQRRCFSGAPQSLCLTQLPKLSQLVSREDSASFHTNVVDPYNEVQQKIRGDLLHPQLPSRANGNGSRAGKA